MTPPSKKTLGFEAAIAELEAIVDDMEAGKLPLDQALAKYQRGTELIRECTGTLQAAEQKIALLEGNHLRDVRADELSVRTPTESDPQ